MNDLSINQHRRRLLQWLGGACSAVYLPIVQAQNKVAPPSHLLQGMDGWSVNRANNPPIAVRTLPQTPPFPMETLSPSPYKTVPLPHSPINATPSLLPQNALPEGALSLPRRHPASFTLLYAQGEVKINGLRAQAKDSLAVGSVIETGANGIAIYRWLDEVVKVFPLTRVLHGDTPQKWIDVDGKISVSTRANGNARVIHTPMVLVQVENTVAHIDTQLPMFSASGEATQAVYVCVCYGQAQLARTQNLRDLLQINGHHHNFPQIVTPRQFQPTHEVLGHSDLEVVQLNNILQQQT